MTRLERLRELETMFEGFVANCTCQQCRNALASIRRQIEEETNETI